MKKKIILISGFVLVIDQIIKYIVSSFHARFVLIPNLISFVYVENKGVAFSALSGKRMFIILISLILIGVLIFMLKSEKKVNKTLIWSYGLLFGGIFGNLIDRIIRGFVIDFISLNILGYYFPVFNIADFAITMGVILLIINSIKQKKVC